MASNTENYAQTPWAGAAALLSGVCNSFRGCTYSSIRPNTGATVPKSSSAARTKEDCKLGILPVAQQSGQNRRELSSMLVYLLLCHFRRRSSSCNGFQAALFTSLRRLQDPAPTTRTHYTRYTHYTPCTFPIIPPLHYTILIIPDSTIFPPVIEGDGDRNQAILKLPAISLPEDMPI